MAGEASTKLHGVRGPAESECQRSVHHLLQQTCYMIMIASVSLCAWKQDEVPNYGIQTFNGLVFTTVGHWARHCNEYYSICTDNNIVLAFAH